MRLAILHVGGLVAIGFDPEGRYVLVVSHSGRGLFEVASWQRVARDDAPAYPADGKVEGIGPLAGRRLDVAEVDYDTGTLRVSSPRGDLVLSYAEGTIEVTRAGT